MPLENVRGKKKESAVDFVIKTFKEQLEKKELRPGDRIPNETELSEMLSVSRGSVREAMKILSALGVIDIQRGNGTFISQPDSLSSMDPVLFSFLLMSPTKKEIMDFRTAVEREVLYMAVKNADDEDIKNLRENLENFKSVSGDGQTLESLKLETDLTFHHLLGKATHNGFMERVYAFAMNYFSPYLLKTYESQDMNSTEYQKRNETNELFIPPGPRLGDKVLEVSNLRKSYGDRLLIDDLSFSIPKGAIVGIIGPNGAGKSTLFRMISGQEQPDSGTITLGETVKLASVDQFRDSMDNSKTVWEEVSGGLDIMKIGNTEMPSRAYVGRFNFKGVDQGKRVGELSGGERGRLHLAKLLQVGGNMLLLDEPTNDLDIETLRALENALLEFPGCAMVISHDRWFLDRIATHILDYQDEGKVEFFEGNFTEYEEYKKRTLGADALEPKRIKYKRIAK